MSPFTIAALGLLALAALVGWSWWRKWHRELAAARHTYHAAAQDVEAATVFYGSMQLDPALERHHVSGQNWRERTMVELAPEALDWPCDHEYTPNVERTHEWCQKCDSVRVLDDPGPGVASSPDPPPGPVQIPTREDAQGRDVRVCATDSRPAAGADLTGSLSSRPHQEDPGWLAHGQPGPASLAPVLERLAGIGDIHEAHQTHPHPEDGWLDTQLADLYDWVRTQLAAA